MRNLRSLFKRIPGFRAVYVSWTSLRDQYGLGCAWLGLPGALASFVVDYRRYRRMRENPDFTLSLNDLWPCLTDRTSRTPIEPVYFYQNAWLARKIFQRGPAQHYDVGSSAAAIAIISQFTPTVMVDIRPVEAPLEGLSFQQGSILSLPFGDRSIQSLSSVCVIEHIGLGRYGDPLDPWGSEKAAAELQRVLAVGGDLYVTVPIEASSVIRFNAHRVFTRDRLLSLFPELMLEEELYQQAYGLYEKFDQARGPATGFFHLVRMA